MKGVPKQSEDEHDTDVLTDDDTDVLIVDDTSKTVTKKKKKNETLEAFKLIGLFVGVIVVTWYIVRPLLHKFVIKMDRLPPP